jgi:hypothetical protein
MTLSGEGSPPLPAVVSFTDAKDPLEEEVEAPKGQGKGKAKAKAKAQAKPKVAPPSAVTREPINVRAAKDLASRVAAGKCLMAGRKTPHNKPIAKKTIREALYEYISRAVDIDCDGIGWIYGLWGQCPFVLETEIPSRLNCGHPMNSLPPTHKIRALADDMAIPPSLATRSVFNSQNSRLIRSCLRTGIDWIVDLDQCVSSPNIQLLRHPWAEHLRYYVENKTLVRNETPPSPEAAKLLFNQILCGGGVKAWRAENKFFGRLPDFVTKFVREQRQIRESDCECFPLLYQAIERTNEGDSHANVDGALQYWLQMQGETQICYQTTEAVKHIAKVVCLEADGNIMMARDRYNVNWKKDLLATANHVFPHSLKSIPSLSELLLTLKAEFPGDWDTKEDHWEKLASASFMFKAEVELGYKKNHVTAAKVVSLSNMPGTTFKINEIFKLTWCDEKNNNTLVYYDFVAQHWRTGKDKSAKMQLNKQVGKILADCIGSVMPPEQLLDHGYLSSVASEVQPLLEDPDFAKTLDNEATKRYVQFVDSVYDRTTDTFIQPHPNLRISLCTGYKFKDFEASPEALMRFQQFVKACAEHPTWEDDLRNDDITAAISKQTANTINTMATKVLTEMPALKVVHSLTDDWFRTFYILLHFTRAFFGCDWYEEFMMWFGNGKNGKDMILTFMKTMFGTYAVDMDHTILCKPIDPTKGQPGLRRTATKRLVSCSEVPKASTFCTDTFKKLRDMRGGKISARFLNENDLQFHPSFLFVVAFNGDREFDEIDGGLLRSLVKEQFPFEHHNLTLMKTWPANYKQVDVNLKSTEYLIKFAPEMVYIFRTLYKLMIVPEPSDSNIRIRGLRPSQVEEQVDALRVPEDPANVVRTIQSFIRECEHVSEPADAASATAIKASVRAYLECTLSTAIGALSGAGFVEGRVTTKRFYRGRLSGEADAYCLGAHRVPPPPPSAFPSW